MKKTLQSNNKSHTHVTHKRNLAIANRSCSSWAYNTSSIYNNPMTLKSRLRVIHGHRKRNHRIYHTGLTVSRVIWRWILPWPWKWYHL